MGNKIIQSPTQEGVGGGIMFLDYGGSSDSHILACKILLDDARIESIEFELIGKYRTIKAKYFNSQGFEKRVRILNAEIRIIKINIPVE